MNAVEFFCNCATGGDELVHYWEHTVGSGHAPLALRADWQDQLRSAHRDLGFQYVRFHGILSDDMGTLIMQNDELLYSFHNADQIVDFLLSIGMRPFVELSLMPEALSSGSETVFRYRGNVTPPRDLQMWAQLIDKLVKHWVTRYGIEEIRRWYFEVWNEPNQEDFWTGTQDEYFALYRVTAETIKRIDGELRVGGPATAANGWIEEFIKFTGDNKVPVDFVSTHQYPTDAFGSPDDDTETQLAQSRMGVLSDEAREVSRKAKTYPVYYTEWNTSSNPRDPLHDEPYAAAYIVKTVMAQRALVHAYSYWTFSDIFEENYFPSMPFHGGFGLMTIHGIPKPSYRAYQLLNQLGDTIFQVQGQHETVDAWVVQGADETSVIMTNLALPRHAISPARVRVRLRGLGNISRVRVQRIDEKHANAKRRFVELDAPEYPTPEQVHDMVLASRLRSRPLSYQQSGELLAFELTLPPQSVAAVVLA